MNSLLKTLPIWLALASPAYSADIPTLPLVPLQPAPLTNAPAPRIEFGSTVYDFGRVMEGTVVEHSFTFTNTGTAPLKISGVHTSCGCTSAGEWSREVAPGQTGSIPIQFSSARFLGPITKNAKVVSNDERQPGIDLVIKGTVWRPVEITPPTAVLNVSPEAITNATALVRIVNNLEDPLKLEAPESNNSAFAAAVTEVQPGKEFHVTVSATNSLPPGTHQASITLKSSSTNMPLIQVIALAIVQPAVMIAPSQILLTANRAPAYAVSIRNNGVNPLVLSDAAVNAEGVGVEIKEVQPGRQFTVMLKFPPNFQVPADHEVALTMKSSHAKFPTIRVPVRQYPPPATRTTQLPQPLWPVPPAPGSPAQ